MAYFPKKKHPQSSKEGLILKSKRGSIGLTYWGEKWEQMLLKSEPSRVSRGRSAARNGRVLSLSFTETSLYAQVEGSSSLPYQVTVEIQEPFIVSKWNTYYIRLSEKALYLASFLEGIMLPNIDELFDNALIPSSLDTGYLISCTCYDWMPECKHALAVFFIITEMIDENPLLIFALRGKPIETLIKHIKALRGEGNSHQKAASTLFWQSEWSFSPPSLPSSLPEVNGYTFLEAAPHSTISQEQWQALYTSLKNRCTMEKSSDSIKTAKF